MRSRSPEARASVTRIVLLDLTRKLEENDVRCWTAGDTIMGLGIGMGSGWQGTRISLGKESSTEQGFCLQRMGPL